MKKSLNIFRITNIMRQIILIPNLIILNNRSNNNLKIRCFKILMIQTLRQRMPMGRKRGRKLNLKMIRSKSSNSRMTLNNRNNKLINNWRTLFNKQIILIHKLKDLSNSRKRMIILMHWK